MGPYAAPPIIMLNQNQPKLRGPIKVREYREMEIECYNCNHRGITSVTLINGCKVWCWVILILLLGPICMFIPYLCVCVPFCMVGCKRAEHKCSNCRALVAYKD